MSEMLELLCGLHSLWPKLVICVVDGLQIVEDRSDREHTHVLQQVVYWLCPSDSARKREDSKTLTEICFTTDGYVDILGAATRADTLDEVLHDFDVAGGRRCH